MTFLWLILWLLSDTPKIEQWNNWAIALIVCVIIDFMGGSETRRRM